MLLRVKMQKYLYLNFLLCDLYIRDRNLYYKLLSVFKSPTDIVEHFLLFVVPYITDNCDFCYIVLYLFL